MFVNTRSAMWFVNQVPTQTPPLDLGPRTPPHWLRVSRGHTYVWQDGRLQALATTVLAPGSSYAGRWSIAVTVQGRAARITGGLYHRADPSPVWFWPIIVAFVCVLAGLRLRRPGLDLRIARGLAAVALASFTVASIGHQLHGRPVVSAGQLVVLAIELAFVAWAAWWLIAGRHNWLTFFLIAGVAAWQGVALAATLIDGYVLLAVPALLGRLAEIGCLAGAAGLVPAALVMADRSGVVRGRSASEGVTRGSPPPDRRWLPPRLPRLTVLLAGCGGSGVTTTHAADPDRLDRTADRPDDHRQRTATATVTIGSAATRTDRTRRRAETHREGSTPQDCSDPSGRSAAAGAGPPRPPDRSRRRVSPAGARRRARRLPPCDRSPRRRSPRVVRRQQGRARRIRDRHPAARTQSGGRIVSARCYGSLVTLDPTGVIRVRRGAHLTVAAVFRSWGRTLRRDRMLSFHGRVRAYVDGRRWTRSSVSAIPLRRHAEIVLEVGPHVPPHRLYHFPPGT